MIDDARAEPGRDAAVPEMTRLRHAGLDAATELESLRVARARQEERLGRLSAERDRLRAQLDAVYASTTWRVGRALLAPITRARRRGARR